MSSTSLETKTSQHQAVLNQMLLNQILRMQQERPEERPNAQMRNARMPNAQTFLVLEEAPRTILSASVGAKPDSVT
jgi:hypothetical protein